MTARSLGTVHQRLRLSLAVVTLVVIGCSVAGWLVTRNLFLRMDATLAGVRADQRLAARFSATVTQELQAATDYLATRSPADEERFHALGGAARTLQRALDRQAGQTPAEAATLAAISEQLGLAENAYARSHRLADLGRMAQARQEAERTLAPHDAMLRGLERLAELKSRREAEVAGRLRADASRQSGLLSLLLLLVVTGVVLVTGRTIERPLEALVRHARRITGGDLSARTEVEALPDEFRVLATAMNWIAEREALQGELREAKEAAEVANRAKSLFLANMSHELRTPLNAIVGFSEMLMEDAEAAGDAALGADLGKIRAAGRHLMGLINDVLDISKIEAGRMELYLESFDVAALVRDVGETAEPLARMKRNRLEAAAEAGAGTMRADQTKVRQILFNLLSNACKFTEGGVVRLRARREGAEVVFTVEDEGIGIPPDKLARLFQPFTQADASVTRRYGGTGLGLTISRHFATLMGGSLDVESQPGLGSRFTMRIPAVVPEPAPEPPSHAERDRVPGATVLVVDDDPDAREVLRRTLELEGFRVLCASGGADALALARAERPAAITLDVMMEGMDGWSALAELKADPALSSIPVVMVTMMDESEMAYALGAADFLVKPVERDRLLAVLARHLPSAGRGTVLVVEDDQATREMLVRTLGRDGWQVREAANGAEALRRVDEGPPALVLLDLVMPEMDGFEFAEAFRRRPESRGVPIVVLTSRSVTDEDRRRLRGSVERVLQKGAHPLAELLAEIRRSTGPAMPHLRVAAPRAVPEAAERPSSPIPPSID